MDAFWIILTGSLTAACCGILGCFLLLRRLSLLGDAVSHAVLPGIFIAYWLSGSRSSWAVVLGAGAFGMLCTLLIEFLTRKARLQSDAATGLVFTLLFAIGVILIAAFAGQIDLDQDCVLYGEIAYVPLDIWLTEGGTNLGPRAVWTGGVLLLGIAALVTAGYKGLFITTFDAEYAATLGISTAFWHYALMGAVSLTTVVSFESVGAVLVVAFLIAPAATAYLLTDNLKAMLCLSVLFGILAAIGGYYLAVWLDGSIAGAMASAMGILFVLVLLWSWYAPVLRQKRWVADL
ncbi:MAG: metal ABC transporter permease [Chitinophagales bacterium]|nr:metal ABC transporter permease [Chitinophagales bacterium]